jgi:hypothetical protein
MKNMFSKRINTIAEPVDPFEVMRQTISDAIDVALKAGCTPGAIHDNLERRLDALRLMEHTRREQQRYGMAKRYVATEHGIKEVDVYAEQAKAEEERNERELRQQQAAYRKSVNERAAREDFLRR